MDTSIEVPSWNNLAENMYLKDSPTAGITLSELASFSFARIYSTEGLPDIGRSTSGERGHIVALQLKAIPFIEEFLCRKKVSSGFYPVGGVSAINLQDEPALFLPNPFDALVVYVTQDSLDEIAYDHQAPRVDRMVWKLGAQDPVVLHLGQTLLSSLERPHHASKIFVDHVLQALKCHLVCAYGGVPISSEQFRGGLSPWQMRRASEFLEAHLDGNLRPSAGCRSVRVIRKPLRAGLQKNLSQAASYLADRTSCRESSRSYDELPPAPRRYRHSVRIR